MDIIEAKDPNFKVGEQGLRISTTDGTVVEFYEGDGIRIVNRGEVPYLEFNIDNKPYSVEINKDLISNVVNRVNHVTEFVQEEVELMDAMQDEKFSTESIVCAYAEVQESQANKTQKMLNVIEKSRNYTFEDKIKKVIACESNLEGEVTSEVLESATDAEESFDEQEISNNKHKKGSGNVSKNKNKDGGVKSEQGGDDNDDDDDEDEEGMDKDDKDEKEGKK